MAHGFKQKGRKLTARRALTSAEESVLNSVKAQLAAGKTVEQVITSLSKHSLTLAKQSRALADMSETYAVFARAAKAVDTEQRTLL